MEAFKFTQATGIPQAIQTAAQGTQVRFIAGGTTLLDLMKLNVERPTQLVDINRLPLDKVESLPRWPAARRCPGPQLRSRACQPGSKWLPGAL